MSEGEKIHRILKFIVKSGQTSYEYDELIPAFRYGLFKKPNVKEIERLCAAMIFDGLVTNAPGKKYGGIAIKPQAIEAYYGNKYFTESEKPRVSSTAVLGVLIVITMLGGIAWLGFVSYKQGEELRQTEAEMKRTEDLNMRHLQRIDSLSDREDSLKQLVDTLRAELQGLKNAMKEAPAKKMKR